MPVEQVGLRRVRDLAQARMPEDLAARCIVRSQQQPFMTVLDCADPSMQVGKRNESLSPLQALSLLNNSLILAMSKNFAAKLRYAT